MNWQAAAESARGDLFEFAFRILGYEKLLPGIHREWSQWTTDLTQLRKLRLEPRDTYKSTVFTIAFPLWLLVQNKPIIRGIEGQNLRILIANAVEDRARDFLREIDGHIRRNDIFRRCFGNLHSPSKWSESQKTIATRTINRKEPSLQAIGKGGQLVSAHYDVAIVDDLVNDEDRDSPATRETTKRWLRDLVSLVHQDGLILIVGTRWHYEDLYHHLIEELNPELIACGQLPYQVVSEGCYLVDGSPRFAQIGLTADRLERLKVEKGSLDFAAQYENLPLPPGSQVFWRVRAAIL